MVRLARALLGLAALAALLAPGAADAGAPGGVEVAWVPTQVCNDVPGPGQNCAKCDEYARKCMECLPGYDFSARGACTWCFHSCMRCERNADNTWKRCTRCFGWPNSQFPLNTTNPGYPTVKSGNKCIKCTALVGNAGCLKCDEATQSRCILCNDGYYLKNGRCVKCSGGPYCEKCNQSGVCTKCVEAAPFARGFGLNSAKFCVPCASPHCTDCASNSARCRSCVNGRAGTGERGWGVAKTGGCAQCADPLCGVCSKNATGLCWGCISDDWTRVYPYLNTAKPPKCTKGKVTNCLYYRRDGACKECNNGYILSNNRCDKLPQCQDPDCYDCRGRTNTCAKCNFNFFWNGDYCQSCINNCEACGNSYSCTRCKKGFGLVKGGRECTRCALQSGGLWDIPWCMRCDDTPHRCKECFPPETFRPNFAGKCVPRVPSGAWN